MVAFTALACLAVALTSHVASATTVFAHFMVQNTYAYTVDQWETDIEAAQQVGIDGFSLNWIPPDCQYPTLDWTVQQIDYAFTAAQNMDFKLMYSFDMSYSTCITYWNTTFMQSMISQYASNSAMYYWNNEILVSTYGGDQVEQYGNSFFEELKSNMAGSNPISLAPALTTYSMGAATSPTSYASQLISDYSSIDGYLNWQAWPLDVDANMTVTADQAFQSALKGAGKSGPYIMAVSPWQYKDLDDGNALDSWVEYSDMLFPTRFEQLTSNSAINPDIIEILTWNDYCESHYIRDLPSTDDTATDFVDLGDMAAYVTGMNHAPWRIIAKYYISYWKNGSPPAITEDQVVYWYRVHPKATICTGGSSSVIRNNDFPVDAVFSWALVKEPATISMTVGSNQDWTYEADGSGPVMGMVPFPSYVSETGITPAVGIMRNGQTVHAGNGSQPITSACAWQNFNPNVNLVGPGMNYGTNLKHKTKRSAHVHHHARHSHNHAHFHEEKSEMKRMAMAGSVKRSL